MDYIGFAEEVNRQIRRRLNELADYLANGSAVDFDHYKQIVGQIHGLAEAEDIIKTLRNNYDQEE